MNKIDAVITFVNCSDNLWLNTLKIYKDTLDLSRFRNWDNLRYLFRGLDEYCKFINKVYLVVATKSQVPSWINQNKVCIVTHDEIIPRNYLPTFNSCCIEMFLGNIKGLSEKFIYFNDDMFVINECTEKNFYIDDKPVIQMKKGRINSESNMYRKQCLNSSNLARKILNVDKSNSIYYKPVHSPNPMLKSVYELYYNKMYSELLHSCTRFRSSSNYNQYIISDFCYFINNYINASSFVYMDFKKYTVEQICDVINNSIVKTICINDAGVRRDKFPEICSKIKLAFNIKFPNKSIYEI